MLSHVFKFLYLVL